MTNETRDRLAELINTKIDCNKDGHGDCSMCEYKCADENCIKYFSELTADYLVENDVTIVVKCRDCEYYNNGFCNVYLQVTPQVKPDDYCSYSKRRTD